METIRPETEVDRTQQAVAADGLRLPLSYGTVEISVSARAIATTGGQRLTSVLINQLARMKGVVQHVHLVTRDAAVMPGTPLEAPSFTDGLLALVDSLNGMESEFWARLALGPAPAPTVRIRIGESPEREDMLVASDGWRALFGRFTNQAEWNAMCPVGAALAATMSATEIFKHILRANGAGNEVRPVPRDFALSGFNHGVDDEAVGGPDIGEIRLEDTAITGCGAGGSAAAYLLSLHPELTGTLTLIEPGHHKLSNLNRYLATIAADVYAQRHKLSSLAEHLARYAPALRLNLHARPWEELDSHPWETLLSAVDTVEGRWQIQQRARGDATIIDIAVDDLLYSVLRVTPNGRCLFCKHPYDVDLPVKRRAARWGVSIETIREWTATDRIVDEGMVQNLANTQNRHAAEFSELLGARFRETPQLIECGGTSLSSEVPSQAPVLPLATTFVGTIAAGEIIKGSIRSDARLHNWLAHDLRRSPTGPRVKHRRPLTNCPNHPSGRADGTGT